MDIHVLPPPRPSSSAARCLPRDVPACPSNPPTPAGRPWASGTSECRGRGSTGCHNARSLDEEDVLQVDQEQLHPELVCERDLVSLPSSWSKCQGSYSPIQSHGAEPVVEPDRVSSGQSTADCSLSAITSFPSSGKRVTGLSKRPTRSIPKSTQPRETQSQPTRGSDP